MVKMTPVTKDNKPPIKLKAKLHDRLTEASCILLGFCTLFIEPNTMQPMMINNPEKNQELHYNTYKLRDNCFVFEAA